MNRTAYASRSDWGFGRHTACGLMVVLCVSVTVSCAIQQVKQKSETPESVQEKETVLSMHKPKEPLPPKYETTDRIEIKTTLGSFVVGLYGKAAPRTVENFLSYVDRGFYSGLIFHRVIAGFMIQGGGFDSALNRAQTENPLKLEIIPGIKHEPGTISMARTSDLHSATSQFFVCVTAATQLNGTYAAFGAVESGYEVVEAISRVATTSATTPQGPSMADVPSTPVVIESVARITAQR